ncbi:hypothetical protein PK28_16995 (plasmid) [Hymenobacter sp. DG25B]|uniref:hypothetical protein n=1 Tax=Hymenobacter sp. DG25B TaxID=1385664 RepID=UPI000540E9A9|nr:hypothetical protein [Hymenobacter sp. DG25B]AIZ65371.1 hypothetical protein PK28_16995 [Hymenobacter sp. DG25B]
MPTPFNPDGRYDGSYEGMFETLVIQGDTVTVHLSSHEFLTADDLAGQAADTAAHYYLATMEVENALSNNDLPALVDTSRPGTVLDGQTVQVYLLASDHTPVVAPVTAPATLAPDAIRLPDTETERLVTAAGLGELFPGRLPSEAAYELVKATAQILSAVGCKSGAELMARGIDLREQLGLDLVDDEMRDALLYIIFGRGPANEADRQQLVDRLVAESGGPLGVDADVVPGGTGPFGRVPGNPVPVAGIVSARLYHERLRTADSLPVEWRRTGSRSGPDGPVDCYELSDCFGESLGEVFISPYHQRISGRAPEGLFLE